MADKAVDGELTAFAWWISQNTEIANVHRDDWRGCQSSRPDLV